MTDLRGVGWATPSEELTALLLEARRQGLSYGQLVANTNRAESCSRKSLEYFEVWWSEASCGFVAGRGGRMRPNMNQATVGRYEIAGNIYDNPEILQAASEMQEESWF